MSSDIWTRCAGKSEIRALRLRARRVVEDQQTNSTRKLVDSDAEQAVLEGVLESSKHPLANERPQLHWLLATPFRYPPLRHGSRFGRSHERSIWYGARTLKTVFAEKAFYELYFLAGTAAKLAPIAKNLTTFSVSVRTKRGIDLTRPPFARERKALASKSAYGATQALGSAMREAAVEAFVFTSARDPDGGDNVGLFTPLAFGETAPRDEERWSCSVAEEAVEFRRHSVIAKPRGSLRFERGVFEVDGKLPQPSA